MTSHPEQSTAYSAKQKVLHLSDLSGDPTARVGAGATKCSVRSTAMAAESFPPFCTRACARDVRKLLERNQFQFAFACTRMVETGPP